MKKLILFALTTVILIGATSFANAESMILEANDFVNKIAFGLIIWSCTMQNTSVSKR